MYTKRHFFHLIITWFACMLSFSSLCYAQVLNIEKERLDKDSLHPLKIKLVADFEFYNRSVTQNQQNKVVDLDIDLNVLYEPGKHAYIFVSEFNYDRTNGIGVLDFGYAHARINWLYDRKLGYENFAQSSYDKSRGMNRRLVTGFNLRYEVLNNKKQQLYVGTGIMYEYEKWLHPSYDLVKNSSMLKSNNFVSYQFNINKVLDLNNVFYYQTGMYQDQLVHRLSNWLILNTKITKRFSLKSSIEMSYEDKPIVPVTHFIYKVKSGVAINF